MQLPTSSKLTCKGNVPSKLEAKGLEPSTLINHVVSFDKDDVDISAEVQSIAGKVVARIASETTSKGDSYADIFDAVNGDGYMAALEARIAHDLAELATSTAPQTRAYKDTLVANVDGLTLADFASDGKGSTKVDKTNLFA